MGFAEKDFVVGYFGRLSGEKRVHTIIQAVSMLPANVKLLIVGRGCLETELRELAAQSLPERHAFTFTDGAMGDLYAASDAVCLASNQEGFSLVMLEAMLSGCAFVSTPVGAAGEVLCDGETGLLFDGSEAGLTHALRQLVDRPLWRRGLAEAGRRRAERFGYASRMARDYEHLLSTLHQRSRSA
jgi:glycosyltransferase involved in cell wall biosynthesis